MQFSFELRRSYLRVWSAICSNLAVVWLVALFATGTIEILTRNVILVIVFVYLAIKAEDALDDYE